MTTTTTTETMKAIQQHSYGPPEVLHYGDAPRPAINADQILVRIHAASMNPYDWHMATGTPALVRLTQGFRRPKRPIQGADMAGVVVAIGADVSDFVVGDEVFGEVPGSFAEFTATTGKSMSAKPANMTFGEAAAVPIAGLTALQGLRDKGGLRAGQRVLINGASGGVGTYAVQIAKALGAHVTAVCSTRNVEMVRSIGADEVIDYTTDDPFGSGRYDLVFDAVGLRSLRDCRRVMADDGIYVTVGGPKKMVPMIGRLMAMVIGSRLRRGKPMRSMLAEATPDDLSVLRELIEAGDVRTVVDRRFRLAETAEAMRLQGEGHARGKTIIDVRPDAERGS